MIKKDFITSYKHALSVCLPWIVSMVYKIKTESGGKEGWIRSRLTTQFPT